MQWFTDEVFVHEKGLRHWLRWRFPWLQDIDDVVQDALFRLWRRQSHAEAQPIACGRAALFTIARNLVCDQVRHQSAVAMESVPDPARLPVLDQVDVVATVSARLELEVLAEALQELPTRCRQVVTLTKIYGYTEREVAERLGVSEHTVRTQVVRGMKHCLRFVRRRGLERGARS